MSKEPPTQEEIQKCYDEEAARIKVGVESDAKDEELMKKWRKVHKMKKIKAEPDKEYTPDGWNPNKP